MKRFLCASVALAVMLASMFCVRAQNNIECELLSTDIGTVIDGAAIKSYNINDHMFIVAEDLRGYGFDVEYDDGERKLAITQTPYASRTLLGADEVNIKKSDCYTENMAMDILDTDIIVTVEGVCSEAYVINGEMIIPVRALNKCAYVTYDELRRLVEVKAVRYWLDRRYEIGEPSVSKNMLEYEAETYSKVYSYGGSKSGQVNRYEHEVVNVEEVNVTDNGIKYYWGNPPVEWSPGDRYEFKNCFYLENCTITDSFGILRYDTNAMSGFCWSIIAPERYIKTENQYQIITYDSGRDFLYGYIVAESREY